MLPLLPHLLRARTRIIIIITVTVLNIVAIIIRIDRILSLLTASFPLLNISVGNSK